MRREPNPIPDTIWAPSILRESLLEVINRAAGQMSTQQLLLALAAVTANVEDNA